MWDQKKVKRPKEPLYWSMPWFFQKFCRKSFERPMGPLAAGGFSVIFSIPAIEW